MNPKSCCLTTAWKWADIKYNKIEIWNFLCVHKAGANEVKNFFFQKQSNFISNTEIIYDRKDCSWWRPSCGPILYHFFQHRPLETTNFTFSLERPMSWFDSVTKAQGSFSSPPANLLKLSHLLTAASLFVTAKSRLILMKGHCICLKPNRKRNVSHLSCRELF